MGEQEVRPPAPHGASPEGPVGGATGAFEFLPQGFNAKEAACDAVRKYPIPCLLGAAAVGFWIGRYRGKSIGIAVAGLASNVLLKEIGRAFDGADF